MSPKEKVATGLPAGREYVNLQFGEGELSLALFGR